MIFLLRFMMLSLFKNWKSVKLRNVRPSFKLKLSKYAQGRPVNQPRQLYCLDFKIQIEHGSNSVVAAVTMLWQSCLPKIYCGGPAKCKN